MVYLTFIYGGRHIVWQRPVYSNSFWERAVNSGAQYNLKDVSVAGGAVNQAGHKFIIGDFIDSIRPDYNNPSLIESAAGYANFIARYDMPMGISYGSGK